MAIWQPKRTIEQPNVRFGICVWKLNDGSYIKNEDGDYFCAQGDVGDKRIEQRMRDAVKSLGVFDGEPAWLPGFRKVTPSEWEDQMELLQDGHTPDPVDLYLQVKDDN